VDGVTAQLRSANIEAKTLPRADVVAALLKAGIPAAAVHTVDEIGVSQRQPGGFIRMVDTGPRRWPLLELPFQLSRMRDYALQPIGGLGNANPQFMRKAS
jgi:crotonobetainyl-CoA:carnitine CoA-transferase CaiB-like acyl-CoA transferase